MARLHIRGYLPAIFDRLAELLHLDTGATEPAAPAGHPTGVGRLIRLPNVVFDDPAKAESDATPIKPQRLMKDLPSLFPPTTHYLVDTGNSMTWGIHYLHPFDRRMGGRRQAKGGIFWTPFEYASMGWAIGAAIGTALAKPGIPVVCVTGDGSVLMSGQELTVAIEQELTVIFVILNDSALGMVRHGQRLNGAEQIGVGLPKVDFAAYARALGAPGLVIDSPAHLQALDFAELCSRRGPTVLDVRVDPEEVPPMQSRMRALGRN